MILKTTSLENTSKKNRIQMIHSQKDDNALMEVYVRKCILYFNISTNYDLFWNHFILKIIFNKNYLNKQKDTRKYIPFPPHSNK